MRAKPAAAKGRYIKGITLTTTMGPGLHVDPTRTRDIAEELDAQLRARSERLLPSSPPKPRQHRPRQPAADEAEDRSGASEPRPGRGS